MAEFKFEGALDWTNPGTISLPSGLAGTFGNAWLVAAAAFYADFQAETYESFADADSVADWRIETYRFYDASDQVVEWTIYSDYAGDLIRFFEIEVDGVTQRITGEFVQDEQARLVGVVTNFVASWVGGRIAVSGLAYVITYDFDLPMITDVSRMLSGSDEITGWLGDDYLTGYSGNDTLNGGDGDDTLSGGSGADALDGGAGNNLFIIEDAFDSIVGGAGRIEAWVDYALPPVWGYSDLSLVGDQARVATGNSFANRLYGNELANVMSGLDGDDFLAGGAGSDSIVGGAGADSINGGGGADTMLGGSGWDLFVVDDAGDEIRDGNDGIPDFVEASVGFVLGAGLGTLRLTGHADIDGAGNNLANEIIGNSGDNRLDGGGGGDTLRGGAGNDDYLRDDFGDQIYEGGTDPNDTVYTSVSGGGWDGIENLVLTGTSDIDGFGSQRANRLTGNDGDNLLDGGAGLDSLAGGLGDDVYVVDRTYLTTANFSVHDPGHVVLHTGTDATFGQAWGSTYADVSDSSADGALDTLNLTYHFSDPVAGSSAFMLMWLDLGKSGLTLAPGVFEFAPDGIDDHGNPISDGIFFGLWVNKLAELPSGSLTIHQIEVDHSGPLPRLITLDASLSLWDATLTASFHYEASLLSHADEVTEFTGEGRDVVQTAFDYTLPDHVETLLLTGELSVDGVGNTMANGITGNSAGNMLTGLGGGDSLMGAAGADTLVGGGGDDWLQGGSGDDQLDGGGGFLDRASYEDAESGVVVSLARGGTQNTGGSGVDRLRGMEGLVGSDFADLLHGAAGANRLDGLAGSDTLKGADGDDQLAGGEGNDLLVGGLGQDNLTGGAGGDCFDYNRQDESGLDSLSWDRISDFDSTQGDKIDLRTLDANDATLANNKFLTLSSGSYVNGATFTAAAQLFFDTDTHLLYGNTDADAQAEFAIELVGVSSLLIGSVML